MRNLRPGGVAFDVGANAGYWKVRYEQAADPTNPRIITCYKADPTKDPVTGVNATGEFRLAPIDGRLPLADGEVDLVWSSEVIEHVADTARWLSEVRRVLAPGGRLLLTTPNHGRLAVAVYGVERYSDPLGDHLHLYTARSLRRTLDEFGFGDVRVWATRGPPGLRTGLRARAVR